AEVQATEFVARPRIQRDTEIDAKWLDGHVIANPQPCPDTQIAEIIAKAPAVDIASVDEDDTAEIAGDGEAELHASHQHAVPAERPVLAVQWANAIGRIAADAARSPCQETHIPWDRLAAGVGFDTLYAEARGQDDALRQGIIMPGFEQEFDETRGGHEGG